VIGSYGFPQPLLCTKSQPRNHITNWVENEPRLAPENDGSALHGILFKLWKASESAKAINIETSKLAELGFYSLVTKKETEKRFVTEFTSVEAIPLIIPTLVGEISYQLRSSLDHLLYLVLNPQTDAEQGKTQLPLRSSAENFGNSHWRMPGASAAIIDEVERIQPYHGREFAVLGHLHTINNRDKHRAISVCAAAIGSSSARISFPQGSGEPVITYARGIAKSGDLAASLDFPDPMWELQQNPDFEFALSPAFDIGLDPDLDGIPVLQILSGAGNLIQSKILPRFAALV